MASILIIDDNEELRDTLVMLLEDEGYATLVAGDGASGVRIFAAARPDLVITDVLMPGADGIETIREIRSLDPDARIIAMSGGAVIGNAYYLRMAKILGAMEVLAKPFEVEELVRAVVSCLGAPRPSAPADTP
ncbi:MAG TPA: response regulator [Stellaceae bacterium]|nr:response regulator [Stellaceae bacterium]